MRPEIVSLNDVTEQSVGINEVVQIDSAGYLGTELEPGSDFTASISLKIREKGQT